MTELHELSDEEFQATFVMPMQDVPDRRVPDHDLDEYCEAWLDVLAGRYGVTGMDLEYVWVNGNDTYEHVVFETNHRRVYLVIVFDVHSAKIFGHHLLDINEKYGLPSPLSDLGLK